MGKLKVKPQTENANKHSPYGLGLLETSIGRDGWIDAITVAADDESISGSARIEVGATKGWDFAHEEPLVVKAPSDRPIVVETTGEQPIIHRRIDIPNADHPMARRLSVAANQITAMDWVPDAAVLEGWAAADDAIKGLFTDDSWAALLAGVGEPDAGGGGDEFDGTPETEGPTRTAVGDLWSISGNGLTHRLIVGDCTDPLVVERLMGGERAALCVTDPPYGVRDDEWDQFSTLEKLVAFTASWMYLCPVDVWAVFFADKYLPLLFDAARHAGAPQWRRSLLWRKPPGSQFAGASLDGFWYDFELISVFGQPQFKPDGPPRMAVFEHRTVTGQEHGCEKPVALLEDIINGYSQFGAFLYEPFMGTGTTLIAAHRAGRKVRGCELSPRYADVILRRAEAAGLTCERQP